MAWAGVVIMASTVTTRAPPHRLDQMQIGKLPEKPNWAVPRHYRRSDFLCDRADCLFILVQRLNQISDRSCKFVGILLNRNLPAKLHPMFFGFAQQGVTSKPI